MNKMETEERSSVAEILRSCDLFATLSEAELKKIAVFCQEDVYNAHDAIYYQGEPSESLYLDVEGTVTLTRSIKFGSASEEATLTTAILTPGQAFGWSALVKPHVHSATAICLTKTKVLIIGGAEIRFLLEKNHHTGFEVMSSLSTLFSERLKTVYRALESRL